MPTRNHHTSTSFSTPHGVGVSAAPGDGRGELKSPDRLGAVMTCEKVAGQRQGLQVSELIGHPREVFRDLINIY